MGYVLGQFLVIMGNRCCVLHLARSLRFAPHCSAPDAPIRPNKICVIHSHTLPRLPPGGWAIGRAVGQPEPITMKIMGYNGHNHKKNSHEKKKFQKTKSKTMLIQHVKGYPDTSIFIKTKLDTVRETSCSLSNKFLIWGGMRSISDIKFL